MSLWAQSDKSGPGSQMRVLPNQPESDLRDRIRLPPLPRLGRCCPSFNSDSMSSDDLEFQRRRSSHRDLWNDQQGSNLARLKPVIDSPPETPLLE